ncbi:methyltransferase domain-containing protein [Flammeovirga sp. MY04]|uniref:class I SAM-dependent methyltransferase n=1 Tax=Flammeovirga sp. MY04 TaxID=1191459 RepID=UPI001305327E|nr:class I SAM-dependent methyltransferase [Flammeovirga sp. MY04]ANQ48044.2 methyltransferase domain-containing protein [Flammeovirga sp. MY04]
MNKTITHYPELTAIQRDKMSYPTRILMQRGRLNKDILDFGCGHGRDTLELQKSGYCVDKYDKYHHPQFPQKKYDTILCHYVLNVLEKADQSKVLAEVSLLLKQGGKAYFTVRRDVFRPGVRIHKYHQKPTYQCNVVLPFTSFLRTEHCEIYEYTKPSDSWLIAETISVAAIWKNNKVQYQKKEAVNARTDKAIALLKEVLGEERSQCFIPKQNTNLYERKNSLRLRKYDYAQEGVYFITINVYQFKSVFGRIINGEMHLNPLGEMVKREWLNSDNIRDNIKLEAFIIMPNHFHGIIIIKHPARKLSLEDRKSLSPSEDIPAIIRGFKGATTKQAWAMGYDKNKSLWQRNFYDIIIRDQDHLKNTIAYINNNPSNYKK